MEFDPDLMFNFLSIFAVLLFLFATCVTVFQKLKVRWPIRVRCWFCNDSTKIWRQQSDWWQCPSCEQFNGFSKDGDYMYDIPEQYNTTNNAVQYCTVPKGTDTSTAKKNELCNTCAKNEETKLLELSRFEPKSKWYYDSELERTKESLEQRYPLCSNCKAMVQSVLRKQSLWLTRYKMLFFKQKPVQTFLKNGRKYEAIIRTIATVSSPVVVYGNELLLLAVGGLFFQLCACWLNTAKKATDVLLSLLWICVILLLPFKERKLLKVDVYNGWFSLEYITQYHTIVVLAVIIAFVNVKHKSYRATYDGGSKFKKLASPTIKTFYEPPQPEDKKTCESFRFKTAASSDSAGHNRQSEAVASTNSLAPIFVGSSPAAERSDRPQSHSLFPERPSASPASDAYSSFSQPARHESSLNDSLRTLSALSLGEDSPSYRPKSLGVFDKRVYGTASPDLFRRSAAASGGRRHSILSAPKLKSVAQTSWVAGGYWQEGMDTPSLSRSSSQSSGFGSAGSNFGPSREPSVHEFDRCSVVSEGHSCCTTRAATGAQRRASPCFGPAKASPAHGQPFKPQLTFVQAAGFAACGSQSCHQRALPGAFLAGPCSQQLRADADAKSPSEMAAAVCANHTTTVVVSPAWLSTLLCCSVVLNMIVLCATCLR